MAVSGLVGNSMSVPRPVTTGMVQGSLLHPLGNNEPNDFSQCGLLVNERKRKVSDADDYQSFSSMCSSNDSVQETIIVRGTKRMKCTVDNVCVPFVIILLMVTQL